VLTKSNNWDSPADVLRNEHRQWELQEKERSNWSEGIKDARMQGKESHMMQGKKIHKENKLIFG
jgi:hypothetical protein